MKILLSVLLCWVVWVEGKRKSEYTQKDWDRIAREWEREEVEEDERERQEEMRKNPGFQFDPNNIGKINPEQLLAQTKKGKPTMVFFNVREKFCKSEKQLTKLTTNWASLLLNGNIPVQNYPVSMNRAIFMVQDGSLSYEVKNFLLKQQEVESVSIDQQTWDADGDGAPTYPGQEKPNAKKKEKAKKKKSEKKDGSKKKSVSDNMSEEQKPKLKKEEKKEHKSKIEVDNTISLEVDNELTDDEFHDKFLKDSVRDAKSPKPMTEGDNKIPDLKQEVRTENDIKTEL